MATQQLPATLPPGWESDYDGTSQRWFFIHRPTGFSQFFFPKAGDEHTRIAELAQPQPTNGSLSIKMEAMTISGNANATVPSPLVITKQPPQQNTEPPQTQPASTPLVAQPPHLQQSPQGSPLARTISQNVQRKAIPRRDSVQSQVSTRSGQSSQSAPQAAQQYQQTYNSQTATQVIQNAQHTQQAQQFQQNAQMQPGQPLQQAMQTPQYMQNHHPPQAQHVQQNPPYIQNQQTPVVQQPPQYQQVIVNGQIQYQLIQPLQTLIGHPGQSLVSQNVVQSPQSFGTYQVPQQAGQPQQIQQTQQYHNPLVQPQYAPTSPQGAIPQQNTTSGQRRFSTIPVLQQPANAQVNNAPPLGMQQVQGTRHSSIPLNNFQPQPLMPQGQQVQHVKGQPVHSGHVPLTYAPQVAQVNTQFQQPPVQYVQQSIATTPQHLPPPAAGMQWVLVQPGAPSPGIQSPTQPTHNGQQTIDPNRSPSFGVQTQQFGGGPVIDTAGRPGLVTRVSSSTMSSSKKAFEASKGFVKKHPGKTMAIVGGLGLVAEACGVNVLTDAVAGSKVYANVQNSKNRKKLLNAAQNPPAQPTQGVNQVNNQAPNGNLNATHNVQPVAQQYPQVMHQQPRGTHPSNLVNGNVTGHPISHGGVVNSQQMFIPQIQSAIQQASHHHFTPQQHHHHQQPSQQFGSQQNTQTPDPSTQFVQSQNGQPQYITQPGQSTDPNTQYIQGQNAQSQYAMQQNPPVQYYQPVDNSQQQFQQQSPSSVYNIQDGSGQNSQQGSGNLANYASDAYNILPNGQGNTQSQPQSPSLMTADNQLSEQQQQLPTPTTSPFDASSQQFSVPSPSTFDPSAQQQQQTPGVSTSPFDPSQLQQFPAPSTSPFDPSQLQQFSAPSTSPFDPSQLQQFPAPSTSPFDPSQLQQFSAPSTPQFMPDLTGQNLMNASIQDDNSYINAPPSPTLSNSGAALAAFNDQVAMDQLNALPSTDDDNYEADQASLLASEEDDMDAAIF